VITASRRTAANADTEDGRAVVVGWQGCSIGKHKLHDRRNGIFNTTQEVIVQTQQLGKEGLCRREIENMKKKRLTSITWDDRLL
jgi:hypothetical protein